MTSPDKASSSVSIAQLLRGLALEDVTLRHLQAECLVKKLPDIVRVNHELRAPTIVLESEGAIAFEHVLEVTVVLPDDTLLGSVQVVMVCTYRSQEMTDLTATELQKYTPSSIIHVWPYLRELVSRTTADFGWPRLTLPTYNANP